jgi:hypothetical protein
MLTGTAGENEQQSVIRGKHTNSAPQGRDNAALAQLGVPHGRPGKAKHKSAALRPHGAYTAS